MLLDGQAGHPAGQPPVAALAHYRQATDLLKTSLLPAARELTDRNAQALERTYQSQHSRTLTVRTWIILAALAAFGALLSLQGYYIRRFRRLLNPALLTASLVVAALAVGGVTLTTDEAERL